MCRVHRRRGNGCEQTTHPHPDPHPHPPYPASHSPCSHVFFFFLENFYCVFIQISPQSQILLKFFSLKLPSHLHINELKITPTDFYDGSPSPTKRRLIDAKFIFKKISKNFKKNLNLICIRVTVNGRVVINEGTGNRTR